MGARQNAVVNLDRVTSYDGNGNQTTGTSTDTYVRDPDGNLIAMQYGGTSYYYTTDTVKSVIAPTDTSQTVVATYVYDPYVYDPYGNTTTATDPMAANNPYRYSSGYTDTTGLIKYGARYYSAQIGRFTQPDPSGQEANRYTYVDDNPVCTRDPSGLSGEGCAVAVPALVSGQFWTISAFAAPETEGFSLIAGGAATFSALVATSFECGSSADPDPDLPLAGFGSY